MRPVLILFAKAPVPGRVKTRLIPPLTPASAARLHTAFVHDSIERLQSLRHRADLVIHTDIATNVWANHGLPQVLQHEGDLGLKMFQALNRALEAGRPQAIIVGSDAPTLPLEHLEALLDSHADMALGPATDGGYYAIACRRADPNMFHGVAWSTEDTLDRTIQAATACGLTVACGPAWYDVDTVDDLERLRADPCLPPHTARFFDQERIESYAKS